MISMMHLLWIIPVSATVGLITAVLCIEAKMSDEEIEDAYRGMRDEE